MLLRGSVFALAAFSLLIVSINGADGRMGDSKPPEGEQMYSIFVPVNVKLDRLDAFVKASMAVAAATVLEPGCWRYDVLQDMDVPSRFYFYEIFQDRAAAEAHWETEHFKTW
jgi:autoinducer 2-degrading protein